MAMQTIAIEYFRCNESLSLTLGRIGFRNNETIDYCRRMLSQVADVLVNIVNAFGAQ